METMHYDPDDYMELPKAGPLTDEQLWGVDVPMVTPTVAVSGSHLCPLYMTPCTAWCAASQRCLAGFCLYEMQAFSREAM